MLSPVAASAPAEVELPKSSLNSSKAASLTELTTDIYSSHEENLYLKFQSKDGDVYELKASYSEEISYHEESTLSVDNYEKTGRHVKPIGEGKAKDGEAVNAADPKKDAWAKVRAWAEQMKNELKQQQVELLKQAMKHNGRTVDSGDGKFLMFFASETTTVEGVKNSDEEAPIVPAYWNAENTSNRIVQMATGFAKVSGLDPKEFAEKIKAAVQEGFSQANAITGPLPGAAGKLNQDTHRLVFEKLDKWLEDWEAEAYNQTAQSDANSATEVSRGTENNQQFASSSVYR